MKMICIRRTVAPYNLAHDDKLHDKSGYKLYQFVTLTWAPIPNALFMIVLNLAFKEWSNCSLCPIFNRVRTWLDACLEIEWELWWRDHEIKICTYQPDERFMQTSAIKNDYSFICVLNRFQLLSAFICLKHRMSNMQMRCLCKVNHTVWSHRHWHPPNHKFNFSRLEFLIRRMHVEHGSESKMCGGVATESQ